MTVVTIKCIGYSLCLYLIITSQPADLPTNINAQITAGETLKIITLGMIEMVSSEYISSICKQAFLDMYSNYLFI